MHRGEGTRQPRAASGARDSDVDHDTHPLLRRSAIVPSLRSATALQAVTEVDEEAEIRTEVVEIDTSAMPFSRGVTTSGGLEHAPHWYVRAQLREDRIARLWVDRQTSQDILVWRDDTGSWAPLLTVPQLRNAIHVQSAMPGPAPAVPSPVRREVAQASAYAEHPVASPSSFAPVVLETGPVDIPGAPRVPDLASCFASAPAGGAGHSTHETGPLLPTRRGSTPPAAPAEPSARPPRVTVRTMDAVGAAPPRAERATRRGRSGWTALLAGDLRLPQAERLAWMAAVVAVSSFAVVTAVLRHRDQPTAGIIASYASRLALAAAELQATELHAAAGLASAAPTEATPSTTVSSIASLPKAPDESGKTGASRSGRSARAGATAATGARASVARTPPASAGPAGFDRNAARLAAISAAARVRYCTNGPASGAVLVTLAPSGMVANASILTLKGDEVRRDCVLRAFQSMRINPFSGAPVTVQKSFSVK